MVLRIFKFCAFFFLLAASTACHPQSIGNEKPLLAFDLSNFLNFADSSANETLQVEKVFDGDTVLLSNGQHVRFLGINTPEVAGHSRPAQAGGSIAKQWLIQQMEHQPVKLEYDQEKQDRYGRTLAYLFNEQGLNINLELVRSGLATVSIFPPNLKYTDALLTAQDEAEQAGLGLWALADYAPLAHTALNETNFHGWKRISGQILTLKQQGKSQYLAFSKQLVLQIENRYLDLFPALASYVGKNIEARGWLYKTKTRYVLPIKHPGDIKLIESKD